MAHIFMRPRHIDRVTFSGVEESRVSLMGRYVVFKCSKMALGSVRSLGMSLTRRYVTHDI